MDKTDFQELLALARQGDEKAALTMVRHFETALLREVRMRLTDPHMREELDSLDICQSILGNFFVRIACGQFDLDEPGQLVGLLAEMARNKIKNHARRKRKEKAGQVDVDEAEVVSPDPDPVEQVSNQELLQRVQESFPTEDKSLLELRLQGYTWAEIAAKIGGNANTLRQRFERHLNHCTAKFGLEEISTP